MSGAPAIQCRNCGADISETYCGKCGQRHLAKGLNLPEITSELLDSAVSLDSRLWRTLVGLTRNPGKLAADYVAGKRASYVNPVRYCIAGVALSVAATIATGEFLKLSLSMVPDGASLSDPYVRQFSDVFGKYMNLLAILSVPVYTLCLRLLFLRAGRNMAEIFSFACFLVGHVSILGVAGTLLNTYVYYMGMWPSIVINSVLTLYGVHVFFGRNLAYTVVASVLSYAGYLVVISGVFTMLLSALQTAS